MGTLSWKQHIEYIANKISSGIGAIRKLRTFIDTSTLVLVYNALIQPYFDYCCEVWPFGTQLEKVSVKDYKNCRIERQE